MCELFCTYLYIYMRPSPLLPPWAAAQTDANLSAHLHRLPTPPPYLRRMKLLPGRGRRCWMANAAADCPWQSSCKSPSTLQKCKLLITRQLTFGAVRGGLDLCSPSTRLKVNHLCIRYLWFESVRGDFLEGHSYASRCRLSLCSSTKTLFLCSKSQKSRVPKVKSAQKPRFCAREAEFVR